MSLVYRPATGRAERDEPFQRMAAEGLLGCAMYAFASPGLGDWRAVTARGLLLRCEDRAGRLLGCGLFSPWRGNLLEFDFTAFRESARFAPLMARGAFAWIFRHLACAGIAGICPLPNRHAWRLAEACGFRVLGRLPGACFYARKGRYVDGVLVTLAREDTTRPPGMPSHAEEASFGGATQEFAMGFGGGMSTPSVPEVAPAPKQEVAKPVTEAATAARQNQRDKAAKAAGIGGSIYTSPLGRARGAERKTRLGQ
ncbi:GNAT family protein, partial [uncultured Desulfovibrio sp.]|uniref:GNAT family N-acetyltransferase n=3 Tax=uncultured Desulfovibrio sp. TaxID=167968 RepID=UPI00261D1CFD